MVERNQSLCMSNLTIMDKTTSKRSVEIDFTKGILIILMVIFHLGHFHTQYPKLTEIVYSFHMPAFLFLSGYLFSPKKDFTWLTGKLRGILLPYFVFEILYILCIGFLGTKIGASNFVDLSIATLLHKLFLHPIGTYWYLHTLTICIIICYLISKFIDNQLNYIILSGIVLFTLSLYIEGLKWSNIVYFLIGIIFKSYMKYIPINKTLLVQIIAFILISYISDNLQRSSTASITLTLLFLCISYSVTTSLPLKSIDRVSYLGRNSLAIVLISPIITPITKIYWNVFAFDSTAILWMLISTSLVCGMSLLGVKIMDKIKISTTLFGKNLYVPYNMVNRGN